MIFYDENFILDDIARASELGETRTYVGQHVKQRREKSSRVINIEEKVNSDESEKEIEGYELSDRGDETLLLILCFLLNSSHVYL